MGGTGIPTLPEPPETLQRYTSGAQFEQGMDIATILGQDLTATEVDDTGDPDYEKVRDVYNTCAGVYNKIVELASAVSLPTPDPLPEDLDGIVIEPFAGSWEKLGENADACRVLDEALTGLSYNIAKVPFDAQDNWAGSAALAFNGYNAAVAVVVRGVGEILGLAKHAFDAIARVSAQLGRVVKRLIGLLIDGIEQIIDKVASRAVPVIGWLKAAYDVISEGTKVITEIVDLIGDCYAYWEDFSQLKETTEAWIDQIGQTLDQAGSVVDVVQRMPRILASGLDSLPHGGPDVEQVQQQVNQQTQTAQNGAGTGDGGLGSLLDDMEE